MATPMSAAQFAAVLRAEGVRVVEVGRWETHNRNSKGPWGPVNGVMIHHTVTSGSAHTVNICRTGYAGLPGPLCHGVITKDGRVHLVGYGRANHAGSGDPDVLKAVINETALPADNEATVDGNRHFYGFECENLGDGQDPWPAAQLEAIERVSAAICRHHGWGARSVIGHLEWQPGKVDPRGFTMDSMRRRVAARLDGNQQEEEDVALSADDIDKVAVATVNKLLAGGGALEGSDLTRLSKAVWDHGISNRFRLDEAGSPKVTQARYFLEWGDAHHDEVTGRLQALQERVDSIAVGGVDLDALAAKVAPLLAAELAARLAE